MTASRSSTAMGRSPPGASATSNAMEEDDDAPPVDALQDDETAQFSPSLQSSTGPTFSTSPRPAEAPRNPFAASVAPAESPNASPFRSTMGTGPSVSLTKSIGSTAASEDAAWRTVLVYGFPGSMHGLVLEHFRGMGEIERVAPGDAGGNWLVLIYVQPWAALRALRRSGELVGGATMVGVRWADDALHREAMLNGINALAAPNGAGPSASAPSPAPGTLHTPSAGAGAGALVGTGTGAGGRTGREGTPSFGRPISVVGASGAAYRVKSAAPSAGAAGSPAGRISRAANLFVTTPTGGKDVAANGNRATGAGPSPGLFADKTAGAGAAQQGQGQGQQARAQGGGVMGRLGDAIFGW